MDTILPQLLAFPPHPKPAVPPSDAEYEKQMKALVHTLNITSPSKLTSSVPGGGDLLDIVDPSINTLPYLSALLAHAGGSSGKQKGDSFNPGNALWLKALDFLQRFDPIQIRYAGDDFRRLFGIVASKVRTSQSHPTLQAMTLSALGLAILRVDSSGATLTSSHLLFVRKCLEARAYSEALPVLNHSIFYFPSSVSKATENHLYRYLSSNHQSSSTFITPESGLSAKLNYQDHLQYFLFGAMCYMGLKEWKRALLFLEMVIISPSTNNASKIQVEAYKKYVLVGLLYKGYLMPMPKTTHVQVAKQCHSIAKAYEGLAEVFKRSLDEEESARTLIDEANAGSGPFWGPDCNSGLVRQVVDAFRQFSVLRLEKTYAALTVADITRRTSPDPNDYTGTGDYLIHLISSDKLNATISEPSDDPASWIVRFSNDTIGPLARSEEQQYEALVKQTRKVKVLMDHIQETDRKLSLSTQYIKEEKKKKKGMGEDGENANPWSHNAGDTFDQDEDMMADHYSSPRNVGSMDKTMNDVGTGLVGAPACGDVMKLQIKVDPETNTISDVKFKTFGCGSAIASSSYLTELVRGMTLEDAGKVRNTEIARELCLPPVKLHCSMLAEDAIKSAISNYYSKNPKAASTDLGGTGAAMPKIEVEKIMETPAQQTATV